MGEGPGERAIGNAKSPSPYAGRPQPSPINGRGGCSALTSPIVLDIGEADKRLVARLSGDTHLLLEIGQPELDLVLRFRGHALMQALEAKQQRLLAEAKAKKSVKPQKEAEEQPEQIETPSGRDLASNALAMARLEGEIAKNIDEYSKRPRLKPISLRTLEYAGAVYLSGWDSKVERVGTLNYPAQARGKLYGAVSVWVVLDSAGAVVRIDVTKPSGQKILDDAARRIIQMGSPYGTIPAKVLDGADHLGFPRTLNFVSGNALKAK